MLKNLQSSSPLRKLVWFGGIQVIILLTLILAACDSEAATTVPLTPLSTTRLSNPSLDNSLPTLVTDYISTSTAYPTATSTPAIPSRSKACRNDDLNITGMGRFDTQMGQRNGYIFQYTNQNLVACFLQGFPKLELFDQNKRPLPISTPGFLCAKFNCVQLPPDTTYENYNQYVKDTPVINLVPGKSAIVKVIFWKCGAAEGGSKEAVIMNSLSDKGFTSLTIPNEQKPVLIETSFQLCKNGNAIYSLDSFNYSN